MTSVGVLPLNSGLGRFIQLSAVFDEPNVSKPCALTDLGEI